jgi:hypothetical protein
MGIAKLCRFASSSSPNAVAARSLLILLRGRGSGGVGAGAAVGVGGGGAKRIMGGSSRELERGCDLFLAEAAAPATPAATPAATPGTKFTFLGLGGSSALSPSEEDEASDDTLSRRAGQGWLYRRLVFGGRVAGGGGSFVASGEEGEEIFPGKLRLRPRLYGEGGTSGARNCLAWWVGERVSLGRTGLPGPVAETCW